MQHCWNLQGADQLLYLNLKDIIFLSYFYENSLNNSSISSFRSRVSKGTKIRDRYNQVPHLTQDTNGKVRKSQLDTTNKSQEVSPFPASDHKVHKNRRAQRHSKTTTNVEHLICTWCA